ncbi:MAG TPA: hypothetical protein PLL20_19175 [Phycisphaerae bacterium]|nr:hypothetical protein [Phycisphaerae bacterium]HRR85689.1 hypothetical protein [Phycisphaerae bacterium]
MKRLILLTAAAGLFCLAVFLLIHWGPADVRVHADEPLPPPVPGEPLALAVAAENNADYAQAESIYRAIISSYPGTAEAWTSQARLVSIKLALKEWDQAVTECDILIAQGPDHPDLAATVLETARVLSKSGKTKKAIRLFEYHVGRWPDSSATLEIKKELALLYARSGNPAVDSLFQELQNTLPPSDDLAELTAGIGAAIFARAREQQSREAYATALGYLQTAEQMYQTNTPSWNTERRAIQARQRIIQAYRAMNDRLAAGLAEDQLLAAYACRDSEHALADALCVLADEHRASDSHARACELYQHALSYCPGSARTCDLMTGLARSSIALADYDTAQRMVNQLATSYSAQADFIRRMNEIAWDYHVAKQNELAEGIYRYVVDNFGDRKEAVFSQSALVIVKYVTGQDEVAAAELTRLFDGFPDNKRKPAALKQVAQACEGLKKYRQAAQAYRLMLQLTSDPLEAERVTLDYIGATMRAIQTQEDAEALLQYCLEVLKTRPTNPTLVHDAVGSPVRGFGRIAILTGRKSLSIEAADRLMAALDPDAPEYQHALARHVRAWAFSWNRQAEEAIRQMVNLADDYAGTTDKNVERLCATSLGHAYGYALANLGRPDLAQQYLDQIRSRWPDGRHESVIELYTTHVPASVKKLAEQGAAIMQGKPEQ